MSKKSKEVLSAILPIRGRFDQATKDALLHTANRAVIGKPKLDSFADLDDEKRARLLALQQKITTTHHGELYVDLDTATGDAAPTRLVFGNKMYRLQEID